MKMVDSNGFLIGTRLKFEEMDWLRPAKVMGAAVG
jgi:hypothetical protein